jgi:hypothetical protein
MRGLLPLCEGGEQAAAVDASPPVNPSLILFAKIAAIASVVRRGLRAGVVISRNEREL